MKSRKQYPLACKDLEEAYRLDPKHKNAKNYLIQILFDQVKSGKKTAHWNNLGQSYEQNGKIERRSR